MKNGEDITNVFMQEQKNPRNVLNLCRHSVTYDEDGIMLAQSMNVHEQITSLPCCHDLSKHDSILIKINI